jgi:hypothetical protein
METKVKEDMNNEESKPPVSDPAYIQEIKGTWTSGDHEKPEQDIIEFLCGADDYDGLWFHETPRDKRPPFWWRRHLREHQESARKRIEELEKENKSLKERLQSNSPVK